MPERLTRRQIFKLIGPFVVLGVVGLVASVLLPDTVDLPLGLAALGLSILIIAAATFTPWHRIPLWTQAVPILLYLVVVALLRQATGGGSSGLSVLVLMPVIWFALYGSRPQMVMTVACIGAVFFFPVAVMSADLYPAQEWVRGALWVVLAGGIGFTMQNLVRVQRQQADKLEASTELFEGTLRSATECSIIATDCDGLITVFNSGAERMLGYSAEEMIGKQTPELIHDPEEVEAYAEELGCEPGFEANVLKAKQGKHEVERWTYVRKDGGRIAVEHTVTAKRDKLGEINGFIGIATDITLRVRAEDAVQDSHDALVAVTRLSKEIAKSANAREAICEAAKEVCGADLVVLMESTGDRHLEMTASVGTELPAITIDLDAESSGSGIAFKTGERLFIPDAVGNSAIATRVNDILQVRSVLFEPVFRGGETTGVLTIGWHQRVPELGARSDMAATMLARDAGSEIERADLMGRLEGAALTDELTGLPNRRAWEEALPVALRRAEELGRPTAVAMFDLDHFKDFNDQHGHQAGDRLLVEAGAAWRDQTREGDVLARYGGEEFVLLMRDCRAEDVREVVERIRHAAPDAVTCSAGFAAWKPGETPGSVVARADIALYEAKAGGRNTTLAHAAAMPERRRLPA